MTTVEIPSQATEVVRRGLIHELVEHAEDVVAEAKILLDDPTALRVADVRNLVGSLVRVTNLLEAFDWPE